jgi:N-acetylglucosaminyl-diphospho-decaprenol L-rhamnosyltransferase
MNKFNKSITFVIVCFNSSDVIEKCIKSINSNIKVIIIENSNNKFIKKHLEKKFSNVKVFLSKENLGYAAGNNLGISKVKTQYAFILNPDAYLKKDTLKEIYKAVLSLKDNFSILAPNLKRNYGYFSKPLYDLNKNILRVDYVIGFAMLLNLRNIKLKEIFDKKFFLFLEEIDLCRRIKKFNEQIFIIKKSKIFHNARKASGNSFNIELCRNWHWMWSLFYYNLKHFGIFVAYRVTLGKFFSSLAKLIISLIFLKKKIFLINKYRLLGLFNAYINKPSWLRPDDIKDFAN